MEGEIVVGSGILASLLNNLLPLVGGVAGAIILTSALNLLIQYRRMKIEEAHHKKHERLLRRIDDKLAELLKRGKP